MTRFVPSYVSLRDHPKMIEAAAQLRVGEPTFVGCLHFLWWWAMEHAPDGDLSNYSDKQIATAARWSKNPEHFVRALRNCGGKKAGFLETDANGGLWLHDWDEYGGKLLAAQDRNTERVRRHRQRNGNVTVTSSPRLDQMRLDETTLDQSASLAQDGIAENAERKTFPLPDGFTDSGMGRAVARGLGFEPKDAKIHGTAFTLHYTKAGAMHNNAEWVRLWGDWLRCVQEGIKPPRPP